MNRINQKERFPPWLKKRFHFGEETVRVKSLLQNLNLHTVCEEAGCPNRGECFAKGRATFMLLGDTCTRNCQFCGVKKGLPLPLDSEEPRRVARAARELDLKHIVITSVTRDDLEDGGAGEFARTISAVRELIPEATVEVLTPDFGGSQEALRKVIKARPDIFNHNLETVPRLYSQVRPRADLETVPRLYSQVRPRADYQRSLELLESAKKGDGGIYTKSGLMLGLGEREKEVLEAMKDLRKRGCDLLTLGQYLQPSKEHYPVQEFIPPEVFEEYKERALFLGFLFVASAPFVRSSYNAEEFFKNKRGQSE
jgi:lipoic acid synthetase